VPTPIGALNVRRSGWIEAAPERVWREFESFERMKAWYGTGHALTRYEPRVGGAVVTDASPHRGTDEPLIFAGRVLVYDPPRELTFEQDWAGHGWQHPALITLRLTPVAGGTMVELFHHGFERMTRTPGEELNGFESGWDNHHILRLRDVVEGLPVGG
jgi:uncharacterized protein YndB with AHSA1/START domain